MKKVIFAVAVMALLISVPAFAEETKKEEIPIPGLPALGFGFKAAGDMPMLVPTHDGVIVLKGNKLLKYDTNLKLIKEVELPPSLDGKQSPLTEKMTEKDSIPAATESQEKPV